MNKDITAVRALLDKIETEAADAEAAPTAEYEIDILAWTEQQAALLRQRAADAYAGLTGALAKKGCSYA
jgi:hypothetical protein